MSPRFPSRSTDDLSWQIRGSRCEACHGHCRHAFRLLSGQRTGGIGFRYPYYERKPCRRLKLEGGEEIIGTVKRILSAGIPIMGHLGLMPQSINKYGTYTVRAKDDAEAEKLVRDAHLLEEAGCFGLVLEKIPAALAARVASELTIPL